MRRHVGVKAVQAKKEANEKFKTKQAELLQEKSKQLSKQLKEFETKLSEFAVKHRNDIARDPEFREHFQDMCGTIGVDPLASSKGFWSEMLGMGNFYYDVSIQALEIILASPINGGVMSLGVLQKRLSKSRSQNAALKDAAVSCKDIKRAIKTLKVFGEGCGVVDAGPKKSLEDSLVYCVPEELSEDSTHVLRVASESSQPYIQRQDLEHQLGWAPSRAKSAIDKLVRENIIWIDIHKGHTLYWFPSLFFESHPEQAATPTTSRRK